MIAPDSDNLRGCERIKKTQVYWHVESLAKKVRKYKPDLLNPNTVINANAEQREIDVFYKIGWEYEHAHSNMTCDITEPIFMQPSHSQIDQLQDYYQRVSSLITRFRTEHEDDTICRVNVLPYLSLQELAQKQSYNLICSKGIYKSSLNAMEFATASMHEEMVKLEEEEGINEDEAGKYWQVKDSFEAIKKWLYKYNTEIKEFPDPERENPNNVPVSKQILQFMGNFVQTVSLMRSEKKSALFNAQPNIEMLSHLIHPVLLGIYTTYRKEKILWENQYEHNINNIVFDERVEKDNRLPEDVEHFQIPKAVFINLDGHESQYNIEFARNMDKHLMYITFPRFENHAEEADLSVNNRFFKKFLFNYSRDMYDYDKEGCDYLGDEDVMQEHRQLNEYAMDDDYHAPNIEEEFHIKYNPQNYYAWVDRMMKLKDSKPKSDKNIYVLPISFKYLFKEMILKTENDAKKYSSYFVWALLKDFVGEDIKKFNPNYIVVSYSGRINIIDSHFTEIFQSLCQASGRKVMLFPNFSSELSEQIALDEVYDNFPPSQSNISATPPDVYRKMCQFLKICSGTYNLQSGVEKVPLLSRYKIGKVNKYILDLLDGLSQNQYEHLANRVPEIIMKSTDIILSRGISQSERELQNLIPPFYKELFSKIKILLLNKGQEKWVNSIEIIELLEVLRNNLVQIAKGENKSQIEYLVNEIIQNYKLEISSQKMTEEALIYFKTRKDHEEFKEIKDYVSSTQTQIVDEFREAVMDYSNNLNGFYKVSLKRQSDRQKLLLTPSSQLIFKVDQTPKFQNAGNGKKTANIMLMNYLSPDGSNFESYAGSVTLSEESKNKVINDRVKMSPITLVGGATLDPHVIRTRWSYAETRNFYILYWPLQYNILEAKLKSIEEIAYQPRILSEVYVARIPNKQNPKIVFNMVNFNEDRQDLIPRKFSSSYDFYEFDKIFIFGGFYEKEKNYLCLQSDITGLDLRHFDEESKKCVVTNEKGNMYSMVNDSAAKKSTTNSYLRTRRQFEFLDLSSMKTLTERETQIQNEEERTVFILGGYGEDFIRPFSLNHCHYYEMTLHIPSRSIRSIKQRTVYDRVMTANVKGMIKNKGSFRKFTTLENGNLKPNSSINGEHYIAHRSVYMLTEKKTGEESDQTRNEDNPYNLDCKVKYFFATKLFDQFKKQYYTLAYRIGESVDKKNDAEEFILSVSPQGNHYLMVQKENKQAYMRQLFLEVDVEQKDKNGRKVDTVALPHGSIISIDIRNKAIYALVHHEVYTKGLYVLAECTLKTEQNEAILTVLHKFRNNMSQYSLFIPKVNYLILLHGLTFEKASICDYFISHKKDGGEVNKQISLSQVNYLPASAMASSCQTYFLKDQNTQNKNLQVESLTFIIPRRGKNNFEISCISNRLKLSFENVNENFYWEHQWNVNFLFVDAENQQKIPISKVEDIREGRLEEPGNFDNGLNLRQGIKLRAEEGMEEENLQKEKNPINTLPRSNFYFIRIVSANKNSYIGILNAANKLGEGKVWKVTSYLQKNAKSFEIMEAWQKAIPVQMHTKSLARYRDINVNIPDAPLG